jgi:hypothetical protein
MHRPPPGALEVITYPTVVKCRFDIKSSIHHTTSNAIEFIARENAQRIRSLEAPQLRS